MTTGYRAVIFDLGGVVFPSPLDAFEVYDEAAGLATGTVRALIRTSSETGAWAALERSELTMDQFVSALEAEATVAGFALDARLLMTNLGNGLGARAEMVRAIAAIRSHGLRTAALTNNWAAPEDRRADDRQERPWGAGGNGELAFDVVVESAVERLRKPDTRIYQLVLDRLIVRAEECVFLDDLGINLKPARAMGMTTIKVGDPDVALRELAETLGFPLDEET